ncbi:hypothetical protein ACOME3_004168 [Neoechinorhynchus agilis]
MIPMASLSGSTKCQACYLELKAGSQVSIFEGQFYHTTCFACQECGLSLKGKQFIKMVEIDKQSSESSFGKMPALACLECSKTRTPRCAQCRAQFDPTDEILVFNEKQYHENCLKCVECGTLFRSTVFVQDEHDLPFCEKCFKDKHPHKRIAPMDLLEKQCESCKEILQSGNEIATFNNRTFHANCLLCDRCSNKPSSLLYTNSDPNGKLGVLCGACYEELAPRCAKCSAIFEGDVEVIEWNGREFHLACFGCVQCGKSLGNQNFVVSRDDPKCLDCAAANDRNDLNGR